MKHHIRISFILVLGLSMLMGLFTNGVQAQVILIGTNPDNVCGQLIVDPGGIDAPYPDNSNAVTTLCSEDTDNPNVQIQFLGGVDLGPGDTLYIYDGNDTNAPLLTKLHEGTPLETITISASVNGSGCLTLSFLSDGNQNADGWIGTISCIPQCQQVEAGLTATDPVSVPAVDGYIDVCLGERILFDGNALFPENNTVYAQSEATSTFTWDFGDGAITTGQTVSYAYQTSGGFVVKLTVTDEQGCVSTNRVEQKIRVAPKPNFGLADTLPAICLGDSLELSGAINTTPGATSLAVNPVTGSFTSDGIRADSFPLPDGQLVTYTSSVLIDEFQPTQILENLDQFGGICVNIEHSWMGDLSFSITCPDGTNVLLHNFVGKGPFYLGEPVPDDEVDGQVTVGKGFDYCWTPTAENAPWEVLYNFDNNPEAPITIPEGDYQSSNAMDPLVGCPLNGEWTIAITDNIEQDNGFVFNWSIQFSDDLLAAVEQFTPAIQTGQWLEDPVHISQYTPQEIKANPSNAGEIFYTYEVEDEFGCIQDTAIAVEVRSPFHPDCSACGSNPIPVADTTVCESEPIQLSLNLPNLGSDTLTFETNPGSSLDQFTNALTTPYASSIFVDNLAPAILGDPAATIAEVCFNLDANPTEDLTLELVAPDGQILTLAEQKGGNGTNFNQTCFSPTATIPIGTATAPFSGTFLPENDWDDLSGSPVNGEWQLRVLDGGQKETKTLSNWTLSFIASQNYTYNWTPTTNISCVDCPTPIISPNMSGAYVLTISDGSTCTISDTLNITVEPILEAPVVTVSQINGQDLTFNWSGLPPGTEFEYRITQDGVPGPWEGPTTIDQLTLPNLPGGTSVTLEVRQPDPGTGSCPPEIQEASAIVIPCGVTTSATVSDLVCFGETGAVQLSTTGNVGPPSYQLLPSGVPSDVGAFSGLAPGTYQVEVTDSIGCTTIAGFELTEPPLLEVTAEFIRTTTCADRNDGVAQAIVTGGEGPDYDILWRKSGLTGLVADSLPVGGETVIVTDQRGCIDSATVLIPGPTPINLTTSVRNPSCSNGNDGRIVATASKAGELLFLEWSTGETNNEISNLGPGVYCVTASDQTNCSVTVCDTLVAPPPLFVDTVVTQPVLCAGGSNGTAAATISGGTAPYNFRWDDPLQQANSVATSLPAGTYNLTITDNAGCTIRTAATISEPDSLRVDLNMNPIVCQGDSTGSVQTTVLGGTAPYSYAWLNGDTSATTSGLPAGRAFVTVTDSNGCTASNEIFVTEPSTLLMASISQTQKGCLGEGTNEAVVQVSNLPDGRGVSFQWSNGSTDSIATNLTAGGVGVTVTDGLGCIARDSLIIQDLSPITFSIQGDRPTCPGLNDGSLGVAIIDGGSGQEAEDYNFLWSTGETTTIIRNLEGNQPYSVTVTDSTGCSATEERFLADPQPILFELATSDVLCAGEANGIAALQDIVAESGFFTIQWDSTIAPINDNNVIEGLSAGTYSISLSDINNCTVDTSFVIEEPAELTLNLEKEDILCPGDPEGSINAQIAGGTPAYDLTWSTGDTSLNLANLPAGAYNLMVTDSNGCVVTSAVEILEPDSIELTVDLNPPSCNLQIDGSIQLFVSGGTEPYQYQLDSNGFGPGSLFNDLIAGNYTVSIQDDRGCTVEEEVLLLEPQPVIIDLGPEVIFIAPGDSVQIQGQVLASDGQTTFSWETDAPSTLSCLDCLNPIASPLSTTNYVLRAMDEGGCEGTARIRIQITKQNLAVVPTGFTPNNDSQNDKLVVHGDNEVQIINFRIFNRWGELVHENSDFPANAEAEGWDGTYLQQPAPSGVYLWVLEVEFLDGTRQVLKGQTTLIR